MSADVVEGGFLSDVSSRGSLDLYSVSLICSQHHPGSKAYIQSEGDDFNTTSFEIFRQYRYIIRAYLSRATSYWDKLDMDFRDLLAPRPSCFKSAGHWAEYGLPPQQT